MYHTYFNGHFLGQHGLVSFHLDSQFPVILILSILTGQAETPHTHTVLQAVSYPLTLTTIQMGLEAEVFVGRMPFLPPTNSVKARKAKDNRNVA